jgi:hypothetical protein
MQYFVVMIDYGRRGREAIVDPEVTRREVVARVTSGEYRNISFIHEIVDSTVQDITADILSEDRGFKFSRARRPKPCGTGISCIFDAMISTAEAR